METKIRSKKNLYNSGKCFTKGKVYTVQGNVTLSASLMEKTVKNDQGQPHIIGSWWRNFEIL